VLNLRKRGCTCAFRKNMLHVFSLKQNRIQFSITLHEHHFALHLLLDFK